MRDLLVAFIGAVLCVLGLLTLFDRAERAFDPPLVSDLPGVTVSRADYQQCFTVPVPTPQRRRPVLHPGNSELS